MLGFSVGVFFLESVNTWIKICACYSWKLLKSIILCYWCFWLLFNCVVVELVEVYSAVVEVLVYYNLTYSVITWIFLRNDFFWVAIKQFYLSLELYCGKSICYAGFRCRSGRVVRMSFRIFGFLILRFVLVSQ